ncbi:MAG: cytochrome C [Deltaproteobacteria bacterium]|nr:MAG: cytochrome C [Deltaproteobacteria bacterium]
MKKLLVVALLIAFAATAAFAADVVTFEAKNGNVTFQHKAHGEKLGCDACHEGTPAKIAIDKKTAHKMCKSCHKAKGVSTSCKTCHKK